MIKKRIIVCLISFSAVFTTSPKAKADLWGGDVVVLTQILIQTIEQLVKLKMIYDTAKDNVDMVREINEGINETLGKLRDIEPNLDPGIFKDWKRLHSALKSVENLYGKVTPSKNSKAHKAHDQSIAESIVFGNSMYQNSKKIDSIGERIQRRADRASPKGAQKLTAQSLGVMLKVQSESLRAQAKEIKLSAQSLARQNQRDKNTVNQILETGSDIAEALKRNKNKKQFILPRFK